METLPPEVLTLLCRSLTGGDVYHLSHVSRRLKFATSRDEIWWHKRNPNSPDDQVDAAVDGQWRARYLSSRSLQTQGRSLAITTSGRRRSVVSLETLFPCWGYNSPGPISLDVWFALFGDNELIEVGGTIVDSYFSFIRDARVYNEHMRMQVNTNRRLLFAMDKRSSPDETGPIGPQLDYNRWYHVAAVSCDSDGDEKVYLDGDCVRTRRLGSLLRGSFNDSRRTSLLAASYKFNGNGFNGVIDEFRVWRRALSDEEVSTLASGCDLERCSPEISIKENHVHGAKHIRCTRPWERVAIKF